MSAEENTAVAQKAVADPHPRPRVAGFADWVNSPVVRSVASSLPQGGIRFLGRAPGGLEILGGLSDYAGSAVVVQPVREFAFAAAQARSDGHLTVVLPREDGCSPWIVPWSRILGAEGAPISADEGRKLVGDSPGSTTLCVVGAVAELLRSKSHYGRYEGLAVAVTYTESTAEGCANETSLIAATLIAVAAALDMTLDPHEAAVICQQVENAWLGDAVGVGHALSVLMARPNTLGLIQCDPHRELAHRELPDDVMLLAIACHASQSDFSRKYEQVRTASFMGRLLADRIARHDRPKSVSWDGYLSGISADAYVEHFRDRIPTKFKGGDFLEHFGETGDPLTRIEPRTIYKVRSRTEHHIYEHLRARQFYDCLDRACDGDEEALAEAGVLMNASHWSYGQRCGLGCIETDFMVNAIRRQKQPDIFGAKLTGRGGGGFVVVLMRPTDQAFEAIGRATRQYSEKTEKPVTIHRDAVPGAYVTGPVVV